MENSGSQRNTIVLFVAAVVILMIIGIVLLIPGKMIGPQVYTTTMQTNTTQTIGPSNPGEVACPAMFAPEPNISRVNSSGFTVYNNVSNFPDYVIAPGTSGNISFTVNRSNASPQGGVLGENTTFYNQIYFYYHSSNSSVISLSTFSPNGINVSSIPSSENLSVNESMTVNIKLSVNASAPQGTYYAIIGLCKASAPYDMLITVGNKPYSGHFNLTPIAVA